ncbi:MAG: hypothetical protein KTR16_06530 [Acidiferrobacterales bacterium]|nr:hypothetical protein [Acidiferrobacterales bacterium]
MTFYLRFTLVVFVILSANTAYSKECVIFLHGLARTSASMQKIADAFDERGYGVANVGYPSRHHPIEKLAPMAIEEGLSRCPDATKVHFITHSLGGILVRYYLYHNALPNMGRVVMLAPPNQGSEVVDNYMQIPGFVRVNGPAVKQLGTNKDSMPIKLGKANFEVGVIAGTKTINPILSLSLENPDDGKVSLQKTKLEGMTDFIAVPHSHPYIMKSQKVIDHAINFIQTGRFLDSQ